MSSIQLQLRFAGQPRRKAAAWRLPGGDAARWLAELAQWAAPHESIRVAPLPASFHDRSAGAALATVRQGSLPPASAGCLAYGKIGSRLYLPVEGELWPRVSAAELERKLAEHRLYVWDPAAGLIALDEDAWLGLSELLAPGDHSNADWNAAQGGVVLASRLTSLRALERLDAEQVIQDGRDDIGESEDQAAALPRSPGEGAAGPLAAVARHGGAAAARAVKSFASAFQGDWAKRLGQWADRKLEQVTGAIEASRHRELERLMHLMETDPDQGLKYALPITDQGPQPRGRSPAGASLPPRDPNFDLSRLGSAGAADAWGISYQYQMRLHAKYREAANRELQLKRFRRAAYIFAELLGDFRAAAGALVAGGHFREAAALYQQKLEDRVQAARCLEQGGLWTEAIELYIELENHVRAGELYEQLGQDDAARQQFRNAVVKMRASGRDRLAIAELLVERLNEPQEAMTELIGAWPDSSQAVACQHRWFELAAEYGTSRQVCEQVNRIASSPMPANALAAADVLLRVRLKYPGADVQALAGDLVLGAASASVRDMDEAGRRQLLQRVADLAPQDRLLERDCRRFAASIPAPRRTVARRGADKQPVLLSVEQLPGHVLWSRMCLCNKSLYVAGTEAGGVRLVHVPWGGAAESSYIWKALASRRLILSACPLGDTSLLLHSIGERRLPQRPIRHAQSEPSTAGSAPGVGDATMAATRSQARQTWTFDVAEALVLNCWDNQGVPLASHLLEPPESDDLGFDVQLQALSSTVYASVNRTLMICTNGRQTQLELPSPIRRLAGSTPSNRPRLAIGLETGGFVLLDGDALQPFGADLIEPEVGFNRGGYLVAAGRGRTEVYDARAGELRLAAATSTPQSDGMIPVAVAGAPRSDRFAILFNNGQLRFYELP